MAVVKHPRHIQRTLAWADRHWLAIALTIVGVSLVIVYSLFIWGAAAESVIRSLRSEQAVYRQELESTIHSVKWQRLARKHGKYYTVIFSPGKTPYYFNKAGKRCKFV